jgi:hypothetical protein
VDDRERERQSREALKRVARDSETIGTSSLARAGRRVGGHFAGEDAVGGAEGGGTDPIELWGRRIGRVLSLIGVVVLAYLLGAQLRLW